MLKLSQPNISDAAITAVGEVLRSGQLVHGPQCEAFERELADYLQCDDVILVSSGTAALHVALLALGIGRGDAVIVPDFTFPATANVVALTGARVVIVDVIPGRYTLDVNRLAHVIEHWRGPERLRAIMPVHEFGCVADMAQIERIAKSNGLLVIEDAACALGANQGTRKAGAAGDAGCFSFHPRKTLTTGEGGAIATNNPAIAARMRRLRNHGMQKNDAGMQFVEPATNYRLTNFQAALGRAQLPYIDRWIEARRQLAASYVSRLTPLVEKGMVRCPDLLEGHSWQTFMIVNTSGKPRSEVIQALFRAGIEANLGAQSLTALGIYGGDEENAPCGINLYRQGIALPFCEQYSDETVDIVVNALTECLVG